MARVVVNGQATDFEPGLTILGALEQAGIHVPALCHDPRLAPVGVCRLCLVKVRGQARPVAACTTTLADGMVIETHTADLEAERRATLRLMAWNYPPADGAPNPLIEELGAYGLLGERRGAPDADRVDESHPYIRVDMSRCIDCFRCQRICDDLQGQFVWRIENRGDETRLVPDSGTTLRASSCVSCGACVDSCPSGALEDRTVHAHGAPTAWTRTVCPYCGVGCEMEVGTRDGRLVQVRPALDAPVNKGHLCVKGRYAFGFVHASDRVTRPMIRSGGKLEPVSWDEALAFVAGELARIREAHGPDAIGVLGSARATNEENYLAQKLARVVLGTNNVDCCARVCHAPSAAALGAMLGTGAATSSFDDIEAARTLVVVGANATENHPVVGARIRQAARRGARLIVVDPRRIELAAVADLHLQLRAGTTIPLLNALAHVILDEDLVDREFVRARVDGLDDFRRFILRFSPERAAAECGVDPEAIRRAARLIAQERPVMFFHGLGLTEQVQGTEGVMAVVNLALLTGNLGRAGAGVNPLRGQNNVQGAAHMGCEPHHLTGYTTLADGRARFEEAWGASLPDRPGLDLMQMMDAAQSGSLRALYAIGYDVLLTNPDAHRTGEALGKLELVIAQDLFLSETAREVATVVLPAASSFEKDGTFMNSERRVQRVRQVVDPPGEAWPDWRILCALARAMGHEEGFAFDSPRAIWDEVRRVWPAGAGMSYPRLEKAGLQWPCPSEDHPGTRILHSERFPIGARATLRCVDVGAGAEVASEEYPFILVSGRKLYHFNAGTMTGRTPNSALQPGDVLDISPADAETLGLVAGEGVAVQSRHGEAVLPIRISGEVRRGELFATFHTAEVFLNRVIGDQRDPVTHTPAYKVTAVRVARRA